MKPAKNYKAAVGLFNHFFQISITEGYPKILDKYAGSPYMQKGGKKSSKSIT